MVWKTLKEKTIPRDNQKENFRNSKNMGCTEPMAALFGAKNKYLGKWGIATF